MLAEDEPRELINQTFNALQTPLKELSVKREIPEELTGHLEKDIYMFSGFKTYHQIEEASRLLKDADGGFKSFERFARDVEKIDNAYNRNYLNAEYNFAAASTQMAVKWKDCEQDGDRYNLQYRTANDGLVREEHAALHNITLPSSDPFWNSYYPPNGWNCRCTAVQVRKSKYPESDSAAACAAGEKATTQIGKDGSNKAAIFRFNPGKAEKIFPPKHPYLPKGCGSCEFRKKRNLSYDPNNPNCQVCDAVYKCISIFKNNEMKSKAQRDLTRWYKEEMPEVMVGKFKAHRFEINLEGLKAIINKNTYNEISNKGRNDDLYIERLVLTKKLHLNTTKFHYQKGKDETGIDHPDAIFKVFVGEIDGYSLKIKVKCNQDENILWSMEII